MVKLFSLKQKVTFITNCKEMLLCDLIEYYKTNDLKYFNKQKKEHKGNHNAMLEFFGDLLEVSGNVSIINRFGKMHRFMRLHVKYETVSLLLESLLNYSPKLPIETLKEIISELKKWGYKIDTSKDIFEQAKNHQNRIQNLVTQMQILDAEIQKDDKKETVDIEEQIIIVSKDLELRFKIDPKETTVYEWEMFKKHHRLLSERMAKHKKK